MALKISGADIDIGQALRSRIAHALETSADSALLDSALRAVAGR
jgi:hypothetical protein